MLRPLAEDSRSHPAPRRLGRDLIPLTIRDAWWFYLFSSVTFGSFVGLASFLNILFHGQRGIYPLEKGDHITLCVIAALFIRLIRG